MGSSNGMLKLQGVGSEVTRSPSWAGALKMARIIGGLPTHGILTGVRMGTSGLFAAVPTLELMVQVAESSSLCMLMRPVPNGERYE